MLHWIVILLPQITLSSSSSSSFSEFLLQSRLAPTPEQRESAFLSMLKEEEKLFIDRSSHLEGVPEHHKKVIAALEDISSRKKWLQKSLHVTPEDWNKDERINILNDLHGNLSKDLCPYIESLNFRVLKHFDIHKQLNEMNVYSKEKETIKKYNNLLGLFTLPKDICKDSNISPLTASLSERKFHIDEALTRTERMNQRSERLSVIGSLIMLGMLAMYVFVELLLSSFRKEPKQPGLKRKRAVSDFDDQRSVLDERESLLSR
jgi:hypothetical protein